MRKLSAFLLVAVLCFSLSVTALAVSTYSFNGTTLPLEYKVNDNVYSLQSYYEQEKVDNPNYTITIVKSQSTGVYWLYRSSAGFYYDNTWTNFYPYEGTLDVFKLSGDYWVFEYTKNVSTGEGFIDPRYFDFVWSSDTVLYDDGSVFISGDSNFLKALSEIILEVTEEQLEKTLPEMGGTMKTLALCGVGLMASLVALKLFGKKSLLFLRK